MTAERERNEAVYRLLGTTIRRLRKQVPMTQKGLAEGIGVARATVANIELGKQRVSIELLYAIGQALRHEPRDLLPSSRELKVPGTVPAPVVAQLAPQERVWLEQVTAAKAPEGRDDAISAEATSKVKGHRAARKRAR